MLDFLLSITLLLGNTTLSSKITKDKKTPMIRKNLCGILKNYNYKTKIALLASQLRPYKHEALI